MDSHDPSSTPEKWSEVTEVTEVTEVEEEYPSKKVVIPAIAAAYVVVFLFSLVYHARQG